MHPYVRLWIAVPALVAGVALTGCVKITPEVDAAFAPAQPGENNHFRRGSHPEPTAPRVAEKGVAEQAPARAPAPQAAAATTPAVTPVGDAGVAMPAAPTAATDGGAR